MGDKKGISKKKSFALIICIAISMFAAVPGSVFHPDEWYFSLEKPIFNPPSWIFSPVWLTLYILIGISLYKIWKNKRNRLYQTALRYFALQWVLNAIWSPLFFGAEAPGIAFFTILLLWIFILVTIRYFYRINKSAAYLLIPYLLWVTFATLLNFEIWRLNYLVH